MAKLRQRGIITAVLCTGPFMMLGKTQARTFGVPDLPLVEIPHPLGGLARDGVKQRADVAVPQLMGLINQHLK